MAPAFRFSITGSPSPTIVTRAAEAAINWVLEKPATEGDLLDFIDASSLGVGVSQWAPCVSAEW